MSETQIMILAAEQHWAVSPGVPTALVYLAAACLAVGWAGLQRLGDTRQPVVIRWCVALVRICAAWACVFWGFQAAGRHVVYATNWPLWMLAALGAVAVELVAGLYALERRMASRRLGTLMLACRCALVLTVVMMLAQPVRSLDLSHSVERIVAVLVDDSASMHLADTQLSDGEKMRLAEAVSRGQIKREFNLEATARRLDELRAEMLAQTAALAAVSSSGDEAKGLLLQQRRSGMHDDIGRWRQTVSVALVALAGPLEGALDLDESTRQELSALRSRLQNELDEPLSKAQLALADDKTSAALARVHGRLLGAGRRAAVSLRTIAAEIWLIGDKLDALAYTSLPDLQKRQAEGIISRTRSELVRDLLGTEEEQSLASDIAGKYGLRAYRFSGSVSELDLRQWSDKAPTSVPASGGDAAATSASGRQTDISGALRKVVSDIPAERLAGVIILTDGRHNARQPLESVAQQLAMTGVPASTVLLGAATGPVDAAIVAAEAPETIYLKDRTFIIVRLKLDGLSGKKVTVALMEGERVADSHDITPPTDSYRSDIQLADEPKTTGAHAYRIVADAQPGEILTSNNEYPLTVHVTDDRTKMLIVEGRSRWEFRYLRNLFTGRDRTVKLQYVLLEPGSIEGAPARPAVHASASRPLNEAEATALPADENEWMKFDVVVLGDVDPDLLGRSHLESLWRFVTDRGGTLVVIGGRWHMPARYAGSKLADMLPAVFSATEKSDSSSQAKRFKIALTSEGKNSMIMRQVVDSDENSAIWNSMPHVYWRNAGLVAKGGATVLAYALGDDAPPHVRKPPSGKGPEASKLQHLAEKYCRTRPLIMSHNVALGRVMFLAFDRTWRMRYRIGDTRHHRFWGHVLRWATAGKLPAGTSLVKLGTDRSHYPADQRVRVMAKIVNEDFSPVLSQEVAVSVYSDSTMVLRKELAYANDSPGMYRADLGVLPSGSYRLELDAPAAQHLLAMENTNTVQTRFSVDATTPEEMIELSADRDLVSRLARSTGGIVVGPAEAQEVLKTLGPAAFVRQDRREYALWDSWPLLVIMVLLATTEWLLRRKAGLI